MAGNGRKSRANGVIDRAIEIGLAEAAKSDGEAEAELRLTNAQEQLVLELCNVFGLSVRSALNAAVRYALYCAQLRGVPPTQLREFPKRLEGREVTFLLTHETQAKLEEAAMVDQLPGCAIAGIKLLHGKTLKRTKASR
jgi:hypothetical protein